MIRDPGPISSLGYGITTRDIPYSGDEREGVSANSGFISKALHDHPIARFLASTAGIVASSLVLSKMLKSGGLKLGKFIQESADVGGTTLRSRVASRFVEDALDLRKYLDELEGYARYVGGPENEGKLVFTRDGVLTTGYDSIVNTSFDPSTSSATSWFSYKTADDIRSAASGITGENAASFAWRDEVQRRLVRAGRQMPYVLPALYGAEKGVMEPLFGSSNEEKRKVKWYNPADVISDFTLTSLKNIATMILPFEVAGATAAASKSSLNTLAYARQEMAGLTPIRKKMHDSFIDIAEVLSEVGHDSAKLFNQAMKFSSKAARGFNAGANAFKDEVGLTLNMHTLRHGAKQAAQASDKKQAAKQYLKNLSFNDVLSKIPQFNRMKAGFNAGITEYKVTGKAYEAMQKGAIFDDIVANSGGLVSQKTLGDAVKKIESLQGTGLARSLKSLSIFGGQDSNFRNSEIYREVEFEEYKRLIYKELKKRTQNQSITISDDELTKFVSNLKVNQLPRSIDRQGTLTNITESISIGKQKIYAGKQADYFDDLLNQYYGLSNTYLNDVPFLKRFGKAAKNSRIQDNTANRISSAQLQDALLSASEKFVSTDTQDLIRRTATRKWNAFVRQDAPKFLSNSLGSRKSSFADFIGELSFEQKLNLQRKTAQVLGIPLTGKDGSFISIAEVENAIRSRGIDPTDYVNLRRFLVANKSITSGITPSGANIFGLKQLTLEEAQDEGIISRAFPNKIYRNPKTGKVDLSREEYLLNLISNYQILDDPLVGGIGNKVLKGVYKTSGGEIVDINAISDVARKTGRFLGSELKFPILGFNPANLFGYESFRGMADTSSIQYISEFSVQPFARGAVPKDSAYQIFYKTKPTKGKVISYSGIPGERGEELAGEYRPFITDSSAMFTRGARVASGLSGAKAYQVTGETGSPFLEKVFGKQKLISIKDRLSIAAEQPNSLIGYTNRFLNRNLDITNPKIIGGLLSEEGAVLDVAGKKVTARIASTTLPSGETILKVVDDAGQEVLGKSGAPLFSEKQILRSVDLLHARLSNYAQPLKVMRQAEEAEIAAIEAAKASGTKVPTQKFTLAGGNLRISEINDETTLFEALHILESGIGQAAKSGNVNVGDLYRAFSRVKSRATSIDFSALAQGAEKSSVKTTEFDEIRNELFNFVTSFNALMSGMQKSTISEELLKIADDLYKAGEINASLKSESQLSTLFDTINNAAFSSYSAAESSTQNAVQRVTNLMGQVRDPSTVSSLQANSLRSSLDPLISGTEAYIGGGAKTLIKPLLPGIRRTLGSGQYQIPEGSINPLGSGQRTTLVPTFKTAAQNVGLGRALASAAGVTTYRDPEAYSLGSLPMQHSVQRLDKYFSSIGTGFEASDFSGPLAMFSNGMVGKRVLPAYIAGTTALTADRVAGGLVGDKDDEGRPIYKPLVTTGIARGIVEMQALASGIVPGGMSYSEKKEQLLEGEIPVRQGRYWPLGNTKFTGGKIMYYRPSWYRRLQAGALFTEDTYGSPIEKYLFYNDTSPLRPLDPYRFERKHYEDRPYPLTGEYFTGPFGPITSIANATVGRILKPQLRMHEDEVNQALSQYAPVGSSGAYNTAAYPFDVNKQMSYGTLVGQNISTQTPIASGETVQLISGNPSQFGGQVVTDTQGAASPNAYPNTGMYRQVQISTQNANMADRAGSLRTAETKVRQSLGQTNAMYVRNKINSQYGTPKVSGVMPPRIVPVGAPIETGSAQYQAGDLAYRLQEMAGIYGFAEASLRQSLGLGNKDVEPNKSVLQSAAKAYGTTRAFWDLNLGGLGDVPLPSQDAISNIEFSEITRRFIPKERSGVDFINPIKNKMGKEYPFLPGPEYFIDFTSGDPYTKVQEGELRLPGIGYKRLHKMYPDETGEYGAVNQLDILGDVAPYSKEYKSLNKQIDKMNLSEEEMQKVQEIRAQVANTTKRYEFSDYKFKGKSYSETGGGVTRNIAGRVGEYIAHADNFIVSKTIGKRTAVEDWERSNVYGTTFPEWQRPVESYIKPMINRASQRDVVGATVAMGIFGALVGVGHRGRLISTAVGATVGAVTSLATSAKEEITGRRHIPLSRKKELALEEYTDILTYVKNKRLENISRQQGDAGEANKYRMAAQRTMYGAPVQDIGTGKYGTDVESLSLAIPKRKREHFKAMINAPEGERERVLSTAGRLERRIYQAAWGSKIEKRPDLTEYFAKHELPDSSWEGWHPNTNMENVKIKMAQSMGLELSEMGYYPQQVKEANLVNPSYPDFFRKSDKYYPSEQEVSQRLQELMQKHGVTGKVHRQTTPFGNQKININSGIN